MKLIALAVMLNLNLSPKGIEVTGWAASPQIAIQTNYTYQTREFTYNAITLPWITLINDINDKAGLEHETRHYWNDWGQNGLLFIPAYAVDPAKYEDYKGANYGPINYHPKYYLFGWQKDKGFNIYQQIYFKR